MGLGMPNFISKGYNSFKSRCIGIRETYNDLKESFAMAKMMLNMTKSIDMNKLNSNPGEMLNQMKTANGLPDAMKNILSSLDADTIAKMGALMQEHFSKLDNTKSTSYENGDSGDRNVYEHLRNPFDKASISGNSMDSKSMNSSTSGEDPAKPPDQRAQFESKPESKSSLNPDLDHRSGEKRSSDEPEYIPSSAYNEIMDIEKKYSSQDKTNQSRSQSQQERKSSNQKQAEEAQPSALNNSMKKILVSEMERRFGNKWKDYIPKSIKDPNFGQNMPDLGLGLGKEGDAAMLSSMSKIFKDLV